MGFWDWITGGTSRAATLLPLTPFAPQDSIDQLVVSQLWPEHDTAKTITRETALRIPAVKRAHDITCGVLSRMPWVQNAGEAAVGQQPGWLSTSTSGLAPRTMRWGVVSDLFMTGWGTIGFNMVEPGVPADAMHIPFGWWSVAADGTVTVDERVPARFRDLVVPIPMGYGFGGMLNDGIDTMIDARLIQSAYRDRIDNPIAQTVLSIDSQHWDYWTKQERADFRKSWIEGRSTAGGATALKPDWVTVEYPSSIPADLFESGRNASRLDLANLAGVPAALVEGAKQSGGGDMHYSTEAGGATRNELWDFGLAKYADAIEARLSLDDVCPPGQSIRVDPSNFLTIPQPTTEPTSED